MNRRCGKPSTGEILASYELTRPIRHPRRDVAALRFADEGGAVKDLRERDIPFAPLALRTNHVGAGEALEIVGYEVIEEVGEQLPPHVSRQRNDASGEEGGGTAELGEQQGPTGHEDQLRSLRDRRDPNMLFSPCRGFLVVRTKHQTFIKTDSTLKSGMCGGAVLDSQLRCCGCVEGIVPTYPIDEDVPNDIRLLEGAACMVEAEDISEFLMDDDLFDF